MEKQENALESPQNSTKNSLITLFALNNEVGLLNYGNIIVRKNYSTFKNVRLISVATANDDLTYAPFVGKGLLTAAILGDTAAPCSRLILRTIRELDSGAQNHGVFVIANSQSNLFNLSLAMERATQDCQLRVKLLLVEDGPHYNKENLSSGYILIVKLLGAMSESGYLYSDIWNYYRTVINNILTIPLDYSRQKKGNKIVINTDLDLAFTQLFEYNTQATTIPLIILLNLRKKLTQLEEYSFVHELLQKFKNHPLTVTRLLLANFINSHGNTATLTIMRLTNDKTVEFIDAPCLVPGWQQVKVFTPAKTDYEICPVLARTGKQYPQRQGPKLSEKQQKTLQLSLEFACNALISCERQLNTIDAERSTGTLGTRFKTASKQIIHKLETNQLEIEWPFLCLKKLSVLVESTLEGVLGSIYGVLLEHAAQFFGAVGADNAIVTPEMWLEALSTGRKAMEQYCSEEQWQTTMFRPIYICESLVKSELENEKNDWLAAFGAGVSGAELGAQETRAVDGQHPDSGAHAVGIWMRALYEGVKFKCKEN